MADQALSRKAVSGGGLEFFPAARYPGTKHSGKQMTLALSVAAWAIASSANVTESAGVTGKRRLASAIRKRFT